MVLVDTSAKRRRHWAIEIKRRIAEESFAGSASVAQLGQKYAVNANQIFLWRKQYREGRLDNNTSTKLLPVTVSKEVVVSAATRSSEHQSKRWFGDYSLWTNKGRLMLGFALKEENRSTTRVCVVLS
jgi:transposase-like protein